MNTIRARVRDGHLVSIDPVAWPKGTEVELSPMPLDLGHDLLGMIEEEQGDSPEAIERWLAAFNAIPLLTMSAAAEAEWLADRKVQRDFSFGEEEVPRS